MLVPHLSLDRISSLPSSIVGTILCFLPIQMAARTSILSREWRYKWTKISKLEFTEWKFEFSTDEDQLSILEQTYEEFNERKSMTKRCKFFSAIFQVLLAHQGPIYEFTLSMVANDTCVEISQLISHLSRSNTLKKLKLSLDCPYMELLSVNLNKLFAMQQLTDLYISGCHISCQSTSDGFGSLTTLCLSEVAFTEKSLLHHLSNLPLLKSFTLDTDLSNVYGDANSTIIELVDCLPMIEHLTLSVWFLWSLVTETGQLELPSSFVYLKDFCLDRLKYLCLDQISLTYEKDLPSLVVLLRSSPNLEKLRLQMGREDAVSLQFKVDPISLENYSKIWLEHLIEVEIEGMNYLKAEWEFVMLILAKSPVLKKVSIAIQNEVTKDEEIKILKSLLRSPRASPLAEIIVERSIGFKSL